jgi:putative ABC transport system permease protein
MSFASLVFRNLFRQRMRTLLTVVGIAVGITIVVALGAITGGTRETVGGWLRIGGADFVVARKGSADFSFSTVSDEEWRTLDRLTGVERSTGALIRVTRHGSNPYFYLLAGVRRSTSRSASRARGGPAAAPRINHEIILGSRAAASDEASPGSTVTIDEGAFGSSVSTAARTS